MCKNKKTTTQLEEQARERIKQQYYGKKQLLIYDDRFVNFDPDSKNDIVGGEKLTYDEYIDIQMRSPNDKGSLFICAIYTPISDFYGTTQGAARTRNGSVSTASSSPICIRMG